MHATEARLTIERVHDIGMRAAVDEVPAALSAIPQSRRLSDPCAMALRALRDVASGNAPGGAALLRRAIEHSDPITAQYLIDLYVPLLLSSCDITNAAGVLESVKEPIEELKAPFLALKAQVAAWQGQDEQSRRYAAEALKLAATVDNQVFVARILQRAAFAAYYREDFPEAQERALEAARLLEVLKCHRHAASAYSILYVLAYDWAGDPDVARFYAQRVAMQARLAGDLGLENNGVVAQLEIAAETGDTRRYNSLRTRFLANRLHEQYRERFSYTIAEVLAGGWAGRFDTGRVELFAARTAENRALGERSLCDALLAITFVAEWDVTEARRYARLALTETAHRSGHQTSIDNRHRYVARIIAAAVCVAIGDPSRGRRSLTRTFDPGQTYAALIGADGMLETAVPPRMRGYARFLNVACEMAKSRRPALGLTAAEMDLLRALPDGMTLAALAAAFGKSPKTIEAQISSIYSKLSVSNRAQAIQRARQLGIYA